MRYSGPERRSDSTDQKIRDLEIRMQAVEKGLHDMAVGQSRNNDQTSEMYELFTAAKGGFKTLELIGKGAKPVLMIGALISAIIVGVKTGVWNYRP